ncbi:MAG: VWA domain-containing protein [Pyrinomonadaceae bacterium]
MTCIARSVFIAALFGLLFAAGVEAQSRHSARSVDADGTILSVFAARTDDKSDPITVGDLYLYENGIEQKIRNFSFDPSPAKIVLLVDNSQTLPTTVDALKKAAMEFAYEIFDGDQLFVIAYDEKAEIIQEWTDDSKKMEASLETFRKKGNPYLFDALKATMNEVLLPLMPGTRKTAVVVIGDGLDRGSSISFDRVLNQLQINNIAVYALQAPDRTSGAYRRDQPKAASVINQLAEGTGGKIFPIEEAQSAAKFICDELRRNRYLLSYSPINTSTYDARRVFLIANEGISVRTKAAQPPNIK